eukprot:COSAG02_NODE_24500_length_686_cov_1.122658_1_plen_138_part_10
MSPDLPKKHEHKSQVAITDHVEDDAAPTWRYAFEDWTTYASSTVVLVQVFDTVKKKLELVGEAKVQLHNEYVPDFDYVMDGDENSFFTVPLHWVDSKGTKLPAGRITLGLVYMPVPDLLSLATDKVTKTWYFEATVLF